MENTSKWNKAILTLVIINFILLIGFALFEFVVGLTYKYEPPTNSDERVLNLKPILLFFAAIFFIFALIELFLGLLTYIGKKWAAIVLLVVGLVCVLSPLGVIAAILALIEPRDEAGQSQLSRN